MNRGEAGANSTSTYAGSAKSVWGSLSDQHPFPEGTFFLVQLTKVVDFVAFFHLQKHSPTVLLCLFVRRAVPQSF